jgi:hypothetical protein
MLQAMGTAIDARRLDALKACVPEISSSRFATRPAFERLSPV